MYLNKPSRISLNVVQVGQGKPRYTLVNLDGLKSLGATQTRPNPTFK
jgi:hypothetical protein